MCKLCLCLQNCKIAAVSCRKTVLGRSVLFRRELETFIHLSRASVPIVLRCYGILSTSLAQRGKADYRWHYLDRSLEKNVNLIFVFATQMTLIVRAKPKQSFLVQFRYEAGLINCSWIELTLWPKISIKYFWILYPINLCTSSIELGKNRLI